MSQLIPLNRNFEGFPSGIVFGLIPITFVGLFVTPYSQY